jgi:hypothetical protein
MRNVIAKKIPGDRIEVFLLKIKAALYAMFHVGDLIRILRLRGAFEGIQLKQAELLKICHAINKFESCRMLVFGMGYDSAFWHRINNRGRTVFLEDLEPWYDRICSMHPELEAHLISYPCKITQWQELLEQPDGLAMELPETVRGTSWDVILVDGPQGHKYSDEVPGRMSSIFEASRLVKKNAYVFVHDAERIVEKIYSQHFLGKDNFHEKVRGRAMLRIYRF